MPSLTASRAGDRHLCLLMMTAAHGAQVGASPRRWCSVCGFAAPYRCVRCGSRFCTRKCYGVHTETRCLKFVG